MLARFLGPDEQKPRSSPASIRESQPCARVRLEAEAPLRLDERKPTVREFDHEVRRVPESSRNPDRTRLIADHTPAVCGTESVLKPLLRVGHPPPVGRIPRLECLWRVRRLGVDGFRGNRRGTLYRASAELSQRLLLQVWR